MSDIGSEQTCPLSSFISSLFKTNGTRDLAQLKLSKVSDFVIRKRTPFQRQTYLPRVFRTLRQKDILLTMPPTALDLFATVIHFFLNRNRYSLYATPDVQYLLRTDTRFTEIQATIGVLCGIIAYSRWDISYAIRANAS